MFTVLQYLKNDKPIKMRAVNSIKMSPLIQFVFYALFTLLSRDANPLSWQMLFNSSRLLKASWFYSLLVLAVNIAFILFGTVIFMLFENKVRPNLRYCVTPRFRALEGFGP